jgi:hypothetical protein
MRPVYFSIHNLHSIHAHNLGIRESNLIYTELY